MRGSIRQQGKRSWEIRVDLPTTDGRRRQKSETVRGTKRDAQCRLNELVHALNAGTYVAPSKVTLGEFLEKWLRDYAEPNVAARTHGRYEGIVRQHLTPALGHYQLRALQPLHIQSHYTEALEAGRKDRSGGLSPTTVLQHHRVLHKALQHALRLGLIARNPTDLVERPKAAKRELQVLDAEQIRFAVEATRGTSLHVPVLLAGFTGMRRGEILALRWSDVDLTAGTAAVVRSLETTRKGLSFKTPKNGKGRKLELGAPVVEGLRRHLAEQKRTRLQLGPAYTDRDLVCPALDGTPRHPDGLTSAWRRFLAQHDLPKVRFHDLRHSHATMLLALNIHPKIVSERLGHSSISITLDTYSHVTPGMQREAVDRLDAALNGIS